jgi:hypothetical protein
MLMDKGITLVVTSCGRYDLLARTLESFYRFNTYPLEEVIIAEDWEREGQVKNIDRAYARVKTPYLLHWEDDWVVTKASYFIAESLDILERYPNVLQVWLRAHNDTNGHPLIHREEYPFPILDPNWIWNGFSWNPGLRRLKDWQEIGGYLPYWNGSASTAEQIISKLYADKGMVATILPEPEGCVRHIGWNRSLPYDGNTDRRI